MQWFEALIIVILPLTLLIIAIYLDYHFWKKWVSKEDQNKKVENETKKEETRYCPNFNLGKSMIFTGVCLAVLYLIVRLMPELLKEGLRWEDVALRLVILAFVAIIVVIIAKTVRED